VFCNLSQWLVAAGTCSELGQLFQHALLDALQEITSRIALKSMNKRSYLFFSIVMCWLAACSQGPEGAQAPKAPPPAEVSVIKATAAPVTVYEEYVAQTAAVDAVEIRARVNGLVERQVFEDGARVKKGDVLFVIDQQPYNTALAQAKAGLAQAQAALVNSRAALKRIRPLVAEQAISKQDLDTAVARQAADAASVEAERANVRQAQLNLEYTTIEAPRDGVMSRALINPGGLVTAAQTLLSTLYSVDPIYVNFTISEQKLLELNKRLERVPGEDKSKAPPFKLILGDGREYKFPGKLNFVDAAFDPKSGTLQVRLAVPNPDRYLRPGLFVRVVVAAYENTDAIRVPQKAVQEVQGSRSLWVIGPDNKASSRQITTASRIDNDWVVEKGLKPGELVVVEGMQKIQPGAVVNPVLASATADEPQSAQVEPAVLKTGN